ncbi:MAG: YjgN family protein [Magnetovibrionaceae bacterium]
MTSNIATAEAAWPGEGAEEIAGASRQGAAEPPLGDGVTYHGRFPDLFVLLFKTGILTLLTIGIYRFWAKTRVRRYLWDSVEIDGSRFEYTGTGKELFVGFLIAVCALVPLVLGLNFLASLLANSVGFPPLALLSWVPIGWVILFAAFRLWRYRLSRTSWRGVCFRIQGKATSFANYAALQYLLVPLTLGLYLPWADAKAWRYRIERTSFGSQGLSFEGDPKKILLPWLVAWAFFVGGYATIAGPLIELFLGMDSFSGDVLVQVDSLMLEESNLFAGLIGLGVIAAYVYGFLKFRFFLSGIRMNRLQVHSNLKLTTLLVLCGWFLVLCLGLFVLTMVVLGVGVGLSSAGLPIQFVIPLVLLVLYVVLLGPLFRGVVLNVMLGAVCKTMTIKNADELSKAAQSGERGPVQGEGLADALDVGAF